MERQSDRVRESCMRCERFVRKYNGPLACPHIQVSMYQQMFRDQRTAIRHHTDNGNQFMLVIQPHQATTVNAFQQVSVKIGTKN